MSTQSWQPRKPENWVRNGSFYQTYREAGREAINCAILMRYNVEKRKKRWKFAMPLNNSDVPQGGIPLADMIETLRRELQRAQTQSADEVIRFETEKVELELQVAISQKATGEGGVQFWVVKAGGKLDRTDMTTHTFRLTLVPVSGVSRDRAVVGRTADRPLSNEEWSRKWC
jgi:hypothetical protein